MLYGVAGKEAALESAGPPKRRPQASSGAAKYPRFMTLDIVKECWQRCSPQGFHSWKAVEWQLFCPNRVEDVHINRV